MSFEALHNGDPQAVQLMYEMLKRHADKLNFPLSKLHNQLEKEYDLTLGQDLSSMQLDSSFINSLFEPSDEEMITVEHSLRAAFEGMRSEGYL